MLVNRPNRVLAHQKYFQAPTGVPLWYKGPRDKFFVTIVFAGLGVGVAGALWGTGKMILGKKD